jgi:hypothetical protein
MKKGRRQWGAAEHLLKDSLGFESGNSFHCQLHDWRVMGVSSVNSGTSFVTRKNKTNSPSEAMWWPKAHDDGFYKNEVIACKGEVLLKMESREMRPWVKSVSEVLPLSNLAPTAANSSFLTGFLMNMNVWHWLVHIFFLLSLFHICTYTHTHTQMEPPCRCSWVKKRARRLGCKPLAYLRDWSFRGLWSWEELLLGPAKRNPATSKNRRLSTLVLEIHE